MGSILESAFGFACEAASTWGHQTNEGCNVVSPVFGTFFCQLIQSGTRLAIAAVETIGLVVRSTHPKGNQKFCIVLVIA
jgi:hypothetical protein